MFDAVPPRQRRRSDSGRVGVGVEVRVGDGFPMRFEDPLARGFLLGLRSAVLVFTFGGGEVLVGRDDAAEAAGRERQGEGC
jgi:hypothetical protein